MEPALKDTQKIERPKLWTLPFIKVMSINTFMTFCNSMMTQALPLYVMFLGASKAEAGLLTGIFTISALICRPFFGGLVDSKGRRFTMLIGCTIFMFTSVGFSITKIVALIMIIRSIQGFGNSAYSTSAGTAAADILPQSRMNEGIGYYGISFNIATAIAPTAMLAIRDGLGYPFVFVGTLILSGVAFTLASTMKYENKKAKAETIAEAKPEQIETAAKPAVVKEKKKFSLEAAVEKTAIPGALVMILSNSPQGLAQTFLVKFGETLGIAGISLYFTFSALAMICSRLFVGRICDRVGAQRALPPAFVLIFCGLALIATSHSLVQFCIAGMFMGFGYGILNPTIQAYVMRTAPQSRRGAASATYYMAIDIGNGVGSILGGILAQLIGFAMTFGLYLFFIVGASLMFVFVLRKKITQSPTSHKGDH